MNTKEDLYVEAAVVERYGAAAKEPRANLCCAVDYDPQYLKIIPSEVIERVMAAAIRRAIYAKARRFSISAAAQEKSVSSPRKLSGQKEGSLAST